MKNKNMKKLFASFALLAVAGAMAGTSTFAWFSMNREVSAGGLGATARSAESLVIGRGINVGSETSVDFTVSDTRSNKPAIQKPSLNPSTWGENCTTAADPANSISGLKVVTGATTISTSTGKVTGGTMVSVKNGTQTSDQYYVDYEVFLAARGAQLSGELFVEFDSATLTMLFDAAQGFLGVRSTAKAYTIAFFAKTVTTDGEAVFEGSPKATLHIADCYKGTVDGGAKASLGTFTFPAQTDTSFTSAVKVGMRVYLDGDLAVSDTDFLKASVVDAGAGIDGKLHTGTTYYTYTGSNGKFVQVTDTITDGANAPDDYYVKAQDCCYVYTDKVYSTQFSFGVKFSVNG